MQQEYQKRKGSKEIFEAMTEKIAKYIIYTPLYNCGYRNLRMYQLKKIQAYYNQITLNQKR